MLLAKKSLMDPIDIGELLARGAKSQLEELRLEIYRRVNALGIGAQGLGGLTTVLDVKVLDYPTHAASLPVAVIPNCAATRHIHFTLDGSGPAVLEPPDLDLWPKVQWTADASARRVFVSSRPADAGGNQNLEAGRAAAPVRQAFDGQRRRSQAYLRIARSRQGPTRWPRFHRAGDVLRRSRGSGRRGGRVGPAGPTTANRMDRFTDTMLGKSGLLAMVGKAERGPETVASIAKHRSAYLIAVGGAAFLVPMPFRASRASVAFPELGMEAVYEFEVRESTPRDGREISRWSSCSAKRRQGRAQSNCRHSGVRGVLMRFGETFDVIVIGGGHAGTEAALAAARMGRKTLLLTHNIETLGQMSCVAIGGIGKGHLVKEIDALGGAMAIAADQAGIQFRTLNASKGPAVRATRAQADRQLYKRCIRRLLETQQNLSLFQQEASDLLLSGERIVGVVTQSGIEIRAAAIVMTVGTFLGGRIHVGLESHAGGGRRRAVDEVGCAAARAPIARRPAQDGHAAADRRTQHRLLRPEGTAQRRTAAGVARGPHPRQVPCHITATNERTHDIIRAASGRSPMFTGLIEGVGPRYCPSVEDKVVRFADRTSHQIFIEPEGLDTHEIYPNGISTSLPFDVQIEFVRSIRGFERAHITRPGYAIEYDFFDPRDLRTVSRASSSPVCSSPVKSTAPPVTRRPRLRGCWRASTQRS